MANVMLNDLESRLLADARRMGDGDGDGVEDGWGWVIFGDFLGIGMVEEPEGF